MNIENLKNARKAKKMTQKDVADILKISQNTYRNYEQGTREPNNETLIKLANFYGVTTDYLLGREVKPTTFPELCAVDDEKFIELYSTLPEYAKQIFVDTMSKLAQAAEQDKKRRQQK